jgi:DegV family protein with EDD domain
MFVAVDTLLYLVKNGRLSRLQGTLGTLLSIKPVLTLNPDGKVETLEKIRTTPKALRRIFELYDEETQDKDVITFINHAHNKQGVEVLTEMIKEKYPERQVIVSFLTPVVGAHAGPKAIALGYIETMSKKTL